VIELEEKLPKKHLLAQQLELGVNYSDDDRIAIITTQYIMLSWREVGGVPALQNCYEYNKPIEINETTYICSWVKEDTHDVPALSRLESWEFMVGGGAAFNQLNGYFLPSNPTGDNELNRKLLSGLRNLRTFIESFDYVMMTRDFSCAKRASIGARVNIISEKGKQYAVYVHHSFPELESQSYYFPNYGKYAPSLTLQLEKGEYTVTFIEPETLKVLGESTIVSEDGLTVIDCPEYGLDLAIKIIAL